MTRRPGPLPFALNIAITNAWVSQLFDQELQKRGVAPFQPRPLQRQQRLALLHLGRGAATAQLVDAGVGGLGVRDDQFGALQRDGLEVDVERAGGRRVHGGAGLGQEVLDDHLLHVAVPAVAGRDRLEGFDAVGP